MAEAFTRADITTADDVRALGADAAYTRLIETGTRPHFIGYYALVMGLQGRPWNDLGPDEKRDLRVRFDALTRHAAPNRPEGIERFLDEIGVRPVS